MYELNLPKYEIRLGGTKEKPEIFDFLRRRFVKLTPEEWVRQHFVHWLTEQKGYPKGLLGNEIELRVGEKRLRCDSILYNTNTQPRMILEYKAPTVPLSQKVFDQISRYNIVLRVEWLIVSNGLQHICCHVDIEKGTYEFVSQVPSYEDL